MCFVKNLAVTFLVRSPVEINNRVPTSQAWFSQIHVIKRFRVESRNKRVHRRSL